jgi:hypothetical protein
VGAGGARAAVLPVGGAWLVREPGMLFVLAVFCEGEQTLILASSFFVSPISPRFPNPAHGKFFGLVEGVREVLIAGTFFTT